MSTYRVEWECCGSVTETEAYEPDKCPFCENSDLASALKNLLSRIENDKDAKKWFLDEQQAARKALGGEENA